MPIYEKQKKNVADPIRLGLIVNPLAGIGGRVGLKGSDGQEIQEQALALGAVPQANLRTAQALETLVPFQQDFELLTPPGEMGETVSRQLGFRPRLVSTISSARTTADDTIRAAEFMQASGVDMILFAGGDGTARDIYKAVGINLPVLGIPAGVKIHSAVFATHPRCAGQIAADYLHAKRLRLREAEVVDLDEDMYRKGYVSTRLFGYLKVPYRPHLVQNQKVPSPVAEIARLDAIAADIIENMQSGWLYILGPGTTTRAIAARLGLPKTLIGVDVMTSQESVALDVSELRLLELVKDHSFKIIVTPIGGQGFLFGRGNQPISPQVVRQAGRENIIVVSLNEKLNTLGGNPMLVDTGDPEVDALLVGHYPVITGYHESVIYRVVD